MFNIFEKFSFASNIPIPDTVYQTKLLIFFGLIALPFVHKFKDERHKKTIIVFISILFFEAASHIICVFFYLTVLGITYIISIKDFEDKGYYFIFVLAILLLSPFLIHNIFNIDTLFYSFAAYYSIYRIIHYYIEVKKNPEFRRSFFDYLFFNIFFPCLCHGPIERIHTLIYKDITKDEFFSGIKKIILGILKVICCFYLLKNLEYINLPPLFHLYIKTIDFYLIVTGDWNIVVGISHLMGFNVRDNVPKSFFFQPSMTKMWRNGNATLIDWYFSYFYVPLAKNNKWLNIKLLFVFIMIFGMHAFFNTMRFPAIHVILYYIMMGVWFGIVLIASKKINDFFKKKEIKKIVYQCPSFLSKFIYGKSMLRYSLTIIINFNIISFGLWQSPFYKLLTSAWGAI